MVCFKNYLYFHQTNFYIPEPHHTRIEAAYTRLDGIFYQTIYFRISTLLIKLNKQNIIFKIKLYQNLFERYRPF